MDGLESNTAKIKMLSEIQPPLTRLRRLDNVHRTDFTDEQCVQSLSDLNLIINILLKIKPAIKKCNTFQELQRDFGNNKGQEGVSINPQCNLTNICYCHNKLREILIANIQNELNSKFCFPDGLRSELQS